MSAADAKIIREALKSELNLNRTKVSVRSPYYGCVNVEVHDATADYDAVKEIAKRQKSISRCEASGEILCGGNTFIFVEYSERAQATVLAERADDIAAIKTAALGLSEEGLYGTDVAGIFINIDGYQWRMKNEANGQNTAWFSPEHLESITRALLYVLKQDTLKGVEA